MSKSYYILHNNSNKNKSWESKVFSWIDDYIAYNKLTAAEIIHDTDVYNLDVVIVGSDLSSDIVSASKRFVENGCKVTVITNLCCDVSYEKFNEGVVLLRDIGVTLVRDFKFLSNEIVDFIKNSLNSIRKSGYSFDGDDYFLNYHYDSIELMCVVDEVEDEYFTVISKKLLGKAIKIKNLYKILECGVLSKIS